MQTRTGRVAGLFWALSGIVAAGAACASPAAPTVCLDPKPALRPEPGAPPAAPSPGFSQELFEQIFREIGRPATFITDQPWARCLQAVARGQIDFALGGYYTVERARVYEFSRSYLSLTPTIFSTRRKPVQPQRVQDLQGLRGCGMNGASYEHYGLAPDALDVGVNSFPRLFEKMFRDRCDYIPEELEMIVGVKLHGVELTARQDLVQAPAPWARAPTKHLMAGKGAQAAALLPAIDQALFKAIQSGAAAELWRRHVPEAAYKP